MKWKIWNETLTYRLNDQRAHTERGQIPVQPKGFHIISIRQAVSQTKIPLSGMKRFFVYKYLALRLSG